MIEGIYVKKELSSPDKDLCGRFIGIARLIVTREMIVGQDEGMSVCKQGTFEDLTRMDKCGIKGSPADHLDTDDLVLRLQVW